MNIQYKACPCCTSALISKKLTAKDYTVTKESFEIWQCDNCTFNFTQAIPDADAIGKYYQSENYVSHSNTSKGIINFLYHKVRNITLVSKRKLVIQSTKMNSGNLLDVGSGIGAFGNEMKQNGWNITGLEPDAGARQIALTDYQLTLQTPDALFQLEPSQFNAITLWHVLEHVHQLHEYFEQFHQLLQQEGCLIIAVPNYTSYDADAYKADWAAYDVPRHLYHFSPKSMEVLAAAHGFKIVALQPMWFDSFYVSMLSEKNKFGKLNLFRAFYNGLVSNIKTVFNNKKCSSLIYVLKKL